MMEKLEQTLGSHEVAEIVEKEHHNVLKDIRRYIGQFTEAKIGFNDFFYESTYIDAKGETRPCYRITRKGCEFIAHKLTGVKGTIFTARYINRFHEMEAELIEQKALPWFIRDYRGKYIILERDFITITGVDIGKRKGFYCDDLRPGNDWNACSNNATNAKIWREYGVDLGSDSIMRYYYPSGVRKALRILKYDKGVKTNPGSYELLMNALDKLPKRKAEKALPATVSEAKREVPITVSIMLNGSTVKVIAE